MGKFVYHGDKRTSEDVSRRASQSGGMYDSWLSSDVKQFKVKEGDVQLRILPGSWPEEEVEKWGNSWEIGVYLHYDVGPDHNAYLCLDKMKGEPCPVCEARADTDDPDEKKDMAPAWRGLAWVIDRDDEKSGPQAWQIPVTLFRDINGRCQGKKDGELLRIDHPEDGYDVMFNRSGTNLKTRYTGVEIDRESSPIHDKEATQDRWLEYITQHPLPSILVYFDYDYIAKVLAGGSSKRKRDDDDEGDSRSARGGRSRDRDEPREEEDRGGRRRRDEGDDERSSRRGAKAEDDEAPFEGGRRRGAPKDEEEERSTRRPRRDEPADERDEREERSSRRRGDDDKGKDEDPPRRRRPTNDEVEEDEARGGKGGKDKDDEESGSSSARRSIDRLRERRGG